jgi:hypothetical protein
MYIVNPEPDILVNFSSTKTRPVPEKIMPDPPLAFPINKLSLASNKTVRETILHFRCKKMLR